MAFSMVNQNKGEEQITQHHGSNNLSFDNDMLRSGSRPLAHPGKKPKYHKEIDLEDNGNMTSSKNTSQRSNEDIIQQQPTLMMHTKQANSLVKFKQINQINSQQYHPESIIDDMLSDTDKDEESAIFHEKPRRQHNDSSVSSSRMQRTNGPAKEIPAASILMAAKVKNLPTASYGLQPAQDTAKASISASNSQVQLAGLLEQKNTQTIQLQQSVPKGTNQVENNNFKGVNRKSDNVFDEDEDDANTLSADRFLIDSTQSRGGVNVPLNSLPKLSRHRKSDLMAHELEGNPQKPSGIAVHFSKRRIGAATTAVSNPSRQSIQRQNAKQPQQPRFNHQSKIEDSGVNERKVLLASVTSVPAPDMLSSSAEGYARGSDFVSLADSNTILVDATSPNVGPDAIRSNSSVSEGSATASKAVPHKDSVSFNRVSLLDQDHIKAPRGPKSPLGLQGRQRKPLNSQGLMLQKKVVVPTATGFLDDAQALRPKSQRTAQPQLSVTNNQRQNHINKFFGGGSGNKDGGSARQWQEQEDALCLSDLQTVAHGEVVADESPLAAQDFFNGGVPPQADENVGDTTPHKEAKTNLSASENLSLSQYLSSSFQNTKRGSQLKQILTMSLTNSQGVGSATMQGLSRKLEVTKRHPAPHLLSSQAAPTQKKEKVNFQVKPSRMPRNTNGGKGFQSVKQSKFQSPSKLARLSASKISPPEIPQRKSLAQSQRHSANGTPEGCDNNEPTTVKGSQPIRVPFNLKTKSKKNEPNSMSIKQSAMEPARLIKAPSVPDALGSRGSNSSVQKVKESGLMKRASFLDASHYKSGLGTTTGSMIKEEIVPNCHTNENRTKVKNETVHDVQIEVIDQLNAVKSQGYQTKSSGDDIPSSQVALKLRKSAGSGGLNYLGQSALQRGMSPPAHVKELSSDSRSSANIVEQQSPSGDVTLKTLNSSDYQLNKFNRSSYKLKQYISDVNKINMRQSELQAKGQKPINGKVTTGSGTIKGKKKANKKKAPQNGFEKRASDSSGHTIGKKKSFQKMQQQSQASLKNYQVTTKTTLASSHQFFKSQQSIAQKRAIQRSTSPQESSLSRVLSYCPASSHRQSGQPLRPGSRQTLLGSLHQPQKGKSRTSGMLNISSTANNDAYFSQNTKQAKRVKSYKQHSLALPKVFRTLLSYLDFMSLFTMMQTRKDYRWDVSTRGKGYQPDYYWVHKEVRKRMKQILLKDGGLRSTVERRNFWIYRSKLNKIRDSYPENHYEKLVEENTRDCNAERLSLTEIGKDIGRTFPDLKFFQAGQPGQLKLHRILTAASAFQVNDQDGELEAEPLGYTQGMNFIAGCALVHLQQHEENTFWFLISLLCEHQFRQVFNFLSEGTFRVLCFQLEVLTQVYLPDLHEHLTKNKVPTDIYASNWFITMFTNDLPFDMAPSVLDVYLLEGHKGLLRIALSILTFLRSELLTLQYDELMVFLSHPNAREAIFRGLDQYWLFQTSYTFKITRNLMNELHRLFIARETLAALGPSVLKLAEKEKASAPAEEEEVEEQSTVARLADYCDMRFFDKLQLCVDQSNVRRRHEWHILMLSPEDVDDLMSNQGLQTDRIEQLRLFYITRVKGRTLDTVLASIELAIKEYRQELGESVCETTPKQSSHVEVNFDIAQENYLRATKKMQVNPMATTSQKAIERRANQVVAKEMPARPFSKASSLSPEITARSSRVPQKEEKRIAISSMFGGEPHESSLLALKRNPGLPSRIPENPDVPQETSSELGIITEDILSNLISPKSSTCGPKQINMGTFRGSQASTPKVKSNVMLARPIRQRNFIEAAAQHSSQTLPYGQPTIKVATQKQNASVFQNWAYDLGSKLENLFKPLSLSPKNGRMQPNINQGLYASANYYDARERRVEKTASAGRESKNYNVSSNSKSAANVYGDEHLDKKSPDAQIAALKAIKSSTSLKERKAMTPHMMLSGDDQIQVNASFEAVPQDPLPKPLTAPQKVQISESQLYYHAGQGARMAYHATGGHPGHQRKQMRSQLQLQKPPRSSSQRQRSATGTHERASAADITASVNDSSSHCQVTQSRSQERKDTSLLRRVLSPPSGSQTRQIPQSHIQIHEIPQSIVERKSIYNLNQKSHQQQQQLRDGPHRPHQKGRVDTAPPLPIVMSTEEEQQSNSGRDAGNHFAVSRRV